MLIWSIWIYWNLTMVEGNLKDLSIILNIIKDWIATKAIVCKTPVIYRQAEEQKAQVQYIDLDDNNRVMSESDILTGKITGVSSVGLSGVTVGLSGV